MANSVIPKSLASEVNTIQSGTVTWNTDNVTGDDNKNKWQRVGRLTLLALEFTPKANTIVTNKVIASGIPVPGNANLAIFDSKGRQMKITSEGTLVWWYPTVTNDYSRIDMILPYFK